MNYYEEIKNELINNIVTKKAKDYSKNKSDLMHYYNVGKLLVDAGKHYGEGIIKEYSKRLSNDLGKGYTQSRLRYFRRFYSVFSKCPTLSDELSYSHYCEVIWLNTNEMNYYINISIEQRLTVRALRERIKNKEYQRLDIKTKNKLINKENVGITDFIKNPIIIRNKLNIENISEKYLKKLILEDISSFMKELGDGFSNIDDEYKIRIGNNYNYIDILLFNYIYNCFVIIELKVDKLKKEHIGQIHVYMNYVDENIRGFGQDKTIGIIICKEDNNLIMKYCSDDRIIVKSYELI